MHASTPLCSRPLLSHRLFILKAIAGALPPEFVNRLDQIVLFNRLPRERIADIAQIEIEHVRSRLRERDLALTVSPAAIAWLAEAGYDPSYGARPVRRAVRQYLLNPLAQTLIGDAAAGMDHVRVDAAADGQGLDISVSQT